MEILNTAFEKSYFYFTACVVGLLFGFGGLVHVGNIFGFGEVTWAESAIQFKIGDVLWGMLDFVAIVGVLMKSPFGIFAIFVAALSQIFVYGFFPEVFMLKEEHRATLRDMVWFHVVVLAVLIALIYFAGDPNGSLEGCKRYRA